MVILLALTSSVLWGASDFVGGLVSRRLPSYFVVALSQLAGLVAVTLAVLATGGFVVASGWIMPACLAGSTLAAGLVMFYAALASGLMGIVSPIAALGVLVPVAVGLLQGDSLTMMTTVGVVLAILGIVAVSGPANTSMATAAGDTSTMTSRNAQSSVAVNRSGDSAA